MKIAVIAIGSTIIAIMLAVLVIVIVTRVVDSRPSPAIVAKAYLDAIAAGKASEANALFDPHDIGQDFFNTSRNDVDSFMSDAALGAATERIMNIRIGSITRAAGLDVAGADFTYDLAGQQYSGHLSMRWSNGEWHLVTGLWQVLHVRVAFPSEGGPAQRTLNVTLGDAHAADQFAINDGSLIAYPGVYPISIDAPGWRADPTEVVPQHVALVTPNSMVLVRARFIAVQG